MHLNNFLFAFKMHWPDHLKLSEKFWRLQNVLKKKKKREKLDWRIILSLI